MIFHFCASSTLFSKNFFLEQQKNHFEKLTSNTGAPQQQHNNNNNTAKVNLYNFYLTQKCIELKNLIYNVADYKTIDERSWRARNINKKL